MIKKGCLVTFFFKIVSILIYTHREREEVLKETESDVYSK